MRLKCDIDEAKNEFPMLILYCVENEVTNLSI